MHSRPSSTMMWTGIAVALPNTITYEASERLRLSSILVNALIFQGDTISTIINLMAGSRRKRITAQNEGVADISREAVFGVMLRASQGRPRDAGQPITRWADEAQPA